MTRNFKVGDKVIFNEVNREIAKEFSYEPNKAYEIKNVFLLNGTIQIINENGMTNTFDKNRFLLAEPKQTKNQRITALENEVAELRPLKDTVSAMQERLEQLGVIVEKVRKPSTDVQEALTTASSVEDIIEFEGAQYKKVDREAREGDVVIFNEIHEKETYEDGITSGKPYLAHFDKRTEKLVFVANDGAEILVYAKEFKRTPETVDVYELIVEDKLAVDMYLEELPLYSTKETAEKSPNEKRAEIIEKAKMFIEKSKNSNGYYSVHDNNNVNSFQKIPFHCKVEFIVNKEKRTVIALMRGFQSNRVLAKGITKCMPGDVFNKYIGMAIALGRALGLDVNEFEQAVQPTIPVVGMVVKYGDRRVARVMPKDTNCVNIEKETYLSTARMNPLDVTIINDTNAIYGGSE